jgi:hypothetical protein
MRALLALLASAGASSTVPGGYASLSEASLNRAVKALIPGIVEDLQSVVLPGVNQSLFWFEPIRFESVKTDGYDVAVKEGSGVEVSLRNMSNTVAHTKLSVQDLLGLVHCTGELWADAEGASYKAINTVVLDGQGKGTVQTVTSPDGFDVGSVHVHHQMDSAGCEAVADVLHLVDGAVIDLLTAQLQKHLAGLVAVAVDKPLDLFLDVLEAPPALGFGKEKFKLDNSFISVNYDNQRITHMHKGEFKSTKNPVESKLTPPQLSKPGQRDAVFSFSDYVLNTLLESLWAEHIGETQIQIPFVKTLFDKECHKCPIAVKSSFLFPGKNNLQTGKGSVAFKNITMEIGAVKDEDVLPMVTLSVNAVAALELELDETDKNYAIDASLSLESLEQDLLVSHIGDIDMSDLTRDVTAVVKELLTTINSVLPALPIPVVAGFKLSNAQVVMDNHEFRVEADLALTDQVTTLPELVVV